MRNEGARNEGKARRGRGRRRKEVEIRSVFIYS
jgi:hypothetical protein